MAEIHTLVGKGYFKEVERLLRRDPSLANAKDNHGRTPLHVAAVINKDDMVKLLIKNGANPNARDEHDRTPLIESAATGSLETIKLLIKHSAKLEVKDRDTGRTALLEATYHLHPKATQALIKAGANAKAKDKEGSNLLHLVVSSPEFKDSNKDRLLATLNQLVPAVGEKAVQAMLGAQTQISSGLTAQELLDNGNIVYVRPHFRNGNPVRGYFQMRSKR